MTDGEVAYYRDLLAGAWRGMREAVCLTCVRGIDEDAMIRAFGGDPADASPRSLPEVFEELRDYHYSEVPSVVLVTSVGDWLIGVELNGFQGSRPEVLRPASAGGTAVSVFWNVNAANSFTYATDGRTRTRFDMGEPEDRFGAEPDALQPHVEGLPFGYDEDTWAAGLALAERVTGLRLPATLLDRTFRRSVLRPVPEDLVYEGLVGSPALDDPLIQAVLAEPTADKLPAITRYLADLVAHTGGIADVPQVRAALDVLATGRRATDELRQGLLALAHQHQAEFRDAFNDGREPDDRANLDRVHAVLGVAGALEPDPAKASFEVHSYANYCVRDPDDRARLSVLYRCLRRAVSRA